MAAKIQLGAGLENLRQLQPSLFGRVQVEERPQQTIGLSGSLRNVAPQQPTGRSAALGQVQPIKEMLGRLRELAAGSQDSGGVQPELRQQFVALQQTVREGIKALASTLAGGESLAPRFGPRLGAGDDGSGEVRLRPVPAELSPLINGMKRETAEKFLKGFAALVKNPEIDARTAANYVQATGRIIAAYGDGGGSADSLLQGFFDETAKLAKKQPESAGDFIGFFDAAGDYFLTNRTEAEAFVNAGQVFSAQSAENIDSFFSATRQVINSATLDMADYLARAASFAAYDPGQLAGFFQGIENNQANATGVAVAGVDRQIPVERKVTAEAKASILDTLLHFDPSYTDSEEKVAVKLLAVEQLDIIKNILRPQKSLVASVTLTYAAALNVEEWLGTGAEAHGKIEVGLINLETGELTTAEVLAVDSSSAGENLSQSGTTTVSFSLDSPSLGKGRYAVAVWASAEATNDWTIGWANARVSASIDAIQLETSAADTEGGTGAVADEGTARQEGPPRNAFAVPGHYLRDGAFAMAGNPAPAPLRATGGDYQGNGSPPPMAGAARLASQLGDELAAMNIETTAQARAAMRMLDKSLQGMEAVERWLGNGQRLNLHA